MTHQQTPTWPEYNPSNIELWSVPPAEYDDQGRIVASLVFFQVEPDGNAHKVDLDTEPYSTNSYPGPQSPQNTNTFRYLASQPSQDAPTWTHVPYAQRQFERYLSLQPETMIQHPEILQVPKWTDRMLWQEAAKRYIKGDIGNVRGLGLLALRSGTLWRLIKTKGLVVTALLTVTPTVLTPIPGDEILAGGTLAVMGASGLVGVIKKRIQIQKELSLRSGS